MKKFMKIWTSSLNVLMLAVLGAITGSIIGHSAIHLKPIGDIFIRLIKMLVIPIVFCAILNSTMKIRKTGDTSNLGLKTLSFFAISSIIAVTLGTILMILSHPGTNMPTIPKEFLNGESLYRSQVPQSHGFFGFILNLIPDNPIKAFADTNILQVVIFTMMLGLGLAFYEGESKKGVEDAVFTLGEVLSWLMTKVMIISPLAVFCLMAYAVGTLGKDVLYHMAHYFLVFLGLFLFWIYGVMGISLKIKAKVPYWEFVKKILPLQIFALTTSSSLVSLPLNMKTAESLGANVDELKFIIPLGTTLNMHSTVMYYTMSAIFFGQMFGIPFHTFDYIAMGSTAIIGAASAAGTPGVSLLIAAVFVAGNVPLTALPLLFAADRLFDMVNTVGNCLGNTFAATFVSSKK